MCSDSWINGLAAVSVDDGLTLTSKVCTKAGAYQSFRMAIAIGYWCRLR